MKCDRRGAYMNRPSDIDITTVCISELRPTLQCRVRTVCVDIEPNCAMELQLVKIHLGSSLTAQCMLDRGLTRHHITDEKQQQPTWTIGNSSITIVPHKVKRHKLAVTKFGTTQCRSIMPSTTKGPWSISSHSHGHDTSMQHHNLNLILSHLFQLKRRSTTMMAATEISTSSSSWLSLRGLSNQLLPQDSTHIVLEDCLPAKCQGSRATAFRAPLFLLRNQSTMATRMAPTGH